MQGKSWQVTLSKCPHCDGEISVTSISFTDLKSSIQSVITASSMHIDRCRGKSKRKLTSISIKQTEKLSEYSTSSSYDTNKILI